MAGPMYNFLDIFSTTSGSPSGTRSSIKISITFERDYVYHLTQSFLQSFLMSLLAYFTFWINMNDFQDRSVNSSWQVNNFSRIS